MAEETKLVMIVVTSIRLPTLRLVYTRHERHRTMDDLMMRAEGMLHQLASGQSHVAADVLARAFTDDPLWRYLVPDRRQRVLLARQAFRATVPFYVRNRQAYGSGTPLEGVAIWRPPAFARTGASALLNPTMLTLLVSPLVRVFTRALPIFAQFDRMHSRYAPEPHFYLSTIGVVPSAQGNGRASALIKPMLATADAEQCSVYTETMTALNVPVYEHYGFACQERWDVPGTHLSIWALYRARRAGMVTAMADDSVIDRSVPPI